MTAPSAFPKFRSSDTLTLADGEYGVAPFHGQFGELRRNACFGRDGQYGDQLGGQRGRVSQGQHSRQQRQYHAARFGRMENFGNGLYGLCMVSRNVSGIMGTYQAVAHVQGSNDVSAMLSARWMGGHQLEKGVGRHC